MSKLHVTADVRTYMHMWHSSERADLMRLESFPS